MGASQSFSVYPGHFRHLTLLILLPLSWGWGESLFVSIFFSFYLLAIGKFIGKAVASCLHCKFEKLLKTKNCYHSIIVFLTMPTTQDFNLWG